MTPRLSCGDKRDGSPNLQNLPAGKETRECFISEIGWDMTSADYSSQESIVLANFSKEPNLINFYEKGLSDSHSYVAFLMYPELRICNVEDVTPDTLDWIKKNHKDKRQIAKAAAFAIAYGGNGATIAKNCNIPKEDGIFVYNQYFKSFPEMSKYFDLGFRRAAHFGYVEFNPITKRKFFFNKEENNYFKYKEEVEELNYRENIRLYNTSKSEIQRISQNYCIQGSSSDITKYACILYFKEILKRGWWLKVKIVNLVHDEIIIETPHDLTVEAKNLLLDCMKEAAKPFCKIVPLGASADTGDHWIH